MGIRKLDVNEFEADAITVTLEGGFESYKEAFLIICNNVGENHHLYSVENYYGNNNVTIYSDPACDTAVTEWLSQFGTIQRKDKVLMYQIEELPDCDYNKYFSQVVVPYSE